MNLELTVLARLAGQQTPGIYLSRSHDVRMMGTHGYVWLCVGPEDLNSGLLVSTITSLVQ